MDQKKITLKEVEEAFIEMTVVELRRHHGIPYLPKEELMFREILAAYLAQELSDENKL